MSTVCSLPWTPIVQGFLDYRPEGGRFHVDNEGVTVASDGVKIIEFEYRPT